ncbi:MAG: DUF4392 domain-containing protein [Alphaproteobacteria bacterium]|nr:DUF4392 domain-containing protein [Alphaproteobacteria bacterium]
MLSETDLAAAPRPPHDGNLHCILVPMPIDEAAARAESERLFETYDPKAVIAIEKNGPNHEGRYCMVDGDDNSDCVFKAGLLFEAAARRDLLTIGIGDRGNEIGFGAIAEVPRRLLPFGEQATDTTVVDRLMTAAVSNWGASAIAAALAAELDRPELMHDQATEARMLEACIAAGGIDGFSCRPVPWTDGMGQDVQVAIATLLNALVAAPAVKQPSVFATPVLGKPDRDSKTG